jgi:hypothetical protein
MKQNFIEPTNKNNSPVKTGTLSKNMEKPITNTADIKITTKTPTVLILKTLHSRLIKPQSAEAEENLHQ